MGTFHQGKGELHGITVVVETTGDELYVGRCDEVAAQGVVLLNADVHRRDGEGPSREEFLRKAVQLGVWGRIPHLVIPREDVVSLRRLGDLEEA